MAGLLVYLRFLIRRERLSSSLWIVLSLVFTAGLVYIYPSLFEDQVNMRDMLDLMTSPAMLALMGPAYNTESLTVMMLYSGEISIFVMISLAVMNIFFVVRHTRNDEELGRLEMINSLPVGRVTTATATFILAVLVNLLIALPSVLAIVIIQVVGTTLMGAIAYALAIFSVGLFFAAVALLTAQLFSTARGASGGALMVLGLAYTIRAYGDMTGSLLSATPPIGLGLQSFAFLSDRLWPSLVNLALTLLIAGLALLVCARRDLGQGVLPARQGRAQASAALLSSLGLTWRLTRNLVMVWSLVLFLTAALYGSVISSITDFVGTNPLYLQVVAGGIDAASTLTDGYTALLFLIMTLLSVVPVINITNHVLSEEKHGRLESMLSRSVDRRRLLLDSILIAFLVSVCAQLICAFGMYVAAAPSGLVDLQTLLMASLVYLPAIWVFIGIGVMLTGLAPRLSFLIWVYYGYAFVIVYIGRMFALPKWLPHTVPFGNVPQIPVDDFALLPLVVLSVIAVALCAIGLWGFKQRDIQ